MVERELDEVDDQRAVVEHERTTSLELLCRLSAAVTGRPETPYAT